MKKNVASQVTGAQMVTISDGSQFTGTARVAITIDGGVQDTSPGGAVVHEGRGYHTYSPTQAETNGDLLAFSWDDSGGLAVPVTVQVYTTDAIVDQMWDEAMVETTGAPAVTGTFRAAFQWVFALSRNKMLQTATTSTLRNDADDTDLATSTISDSGGTATRGEWST